LSANDNETETKSVPVPKIL